MIEENTLNSGTVSSSWFEPGFDKSVRTIIEKNWPKSATLICHDEAHRWAKILLEIRPDCNVMLNDGMFQIGGDSRNSEGHTWLEVDGYIFDPTALQFGGAISRTYYAAHDCCEGTDLVQRLDMWFSGEDSTSTHTEKCFTP